MSDTGRGTTATATETMTDSEIKEMLDSQESTVLTVDNLHADMTAIGAAETDDLTTTQSAIGSATVQNEASLTSSAAGMLSARDVTMHQSGAVAVMAEGDATLTQAGSALLTAHDVELTGGGAGVVLADRATVARGWVGLAATRQLELSDDSRVIVDMRAASIIGGAVVAGFAALGVAIALTGSRVIGRFRTRQPELSAVREARANLAEAIARLRRRR